MLTYLSRKFSAEQLSAMESIREIAKTHGLGGLVVLGNDQCAICSDFLFDAEWIDLKTEEGYANGKGGSLVYSGGDLSNTLRNGAMFAEVGRRAEALGKALMTMCDRIRDCLQAEIDSQVDDDTVHPTDDATTGNPRLN